jgi:hypothetical protein
MGPDPIPWAGRDRAKASDSNTDRTDDFIIFKLQDGFQD